MKQAASGALEAFCLSREKVQVCKVGGETNLWWRILPLLREGLEDDRPQIDRPECRCPHGSCAVVKSLKLECIVRSCHYLRDRFNN